MALFDFLKKLQKKEKSAATKKSESPVADSHDIVAEEKTSETLQIATHAPETFVLQVPHVTERARTLADSGQYTFRINPNASKIQVEQAVEKLYNVHVEHVRIITAHEKPRRRGLTEGVKKGYKKAVVALRKGEAIDIF
jgi:large subunit ribosomal protein L23